MAFEIRGMPCPKCGKKTLTHHIRKKYGMEYDYCMAQCRKCGHQFKEEEIE